MSQLESQLDISWKEKKQQQLLFWILVSEINCFLADLVWELTCQVLAKAPAETKDDMDMFTNLLGFLHNMSFDKSKIVIENAPRVARSIERCMIIKVYRLITNFLIIVISRKTTTFSSAASDFSTTFAQRILNAARLLSTTQKSCSPVWITAARTYAN